MFITSQQIILNPPELQGWQPNFNLGVLALVLKNATFHQLELCICIIKIVLCKANKGQCAVCIISFEDHVHLTGITST
jgi:hypothetical protein